MVTIKGYGQGTCLWCQREGKEGVELVSDDKSFTGFLCFTDLKRLLRLKSVNSNGSRVEQGNVSR